MTLTITNDRDVRPLQAASAIVETYVASATVNVGEIVYIDTDGKVAPARANVALTSRARGIVVASGANIQRSGKTTFAADESVSVLLWGLVSGITGMDLTKAVYLSSDTAGDMTQTAPTGSATWTDYLGYPLMDSVTGETYLFFQPQVAEPTSNS